MSQLTRTLAVIVALSFSHGCASAPSGTKGAALLTTVALLGQGSLEADGYGAYSYVLIPRDPHGDERYIALLHAFARLPTDEPVSPTGMRTAFRNRNITYSPVQDVDPPAKFSGQWLVDNYDYPRAASILFAQGCGDIGPYIITSTTAISTRDSHVEAAIIDLSGAKAHEITTWVDSFAKASNGSNAWGQHKAELVLLKVNEIMKRFGDAAMFTIEAVQPVGKVLRTFRK